MHDHIRPEARSIACVEQLAEIVGIRDDIARLFHRDPSAPISLDELSPHAADATSTQRGRTPPALVRQLDREQIVRCRQKPASPQLRTHIEGCSGEHRDRSSTSQPEVVFLVDVQAADQVKHLQHHRRLDKPRRSNRASEGPSRFLGKGPLTWTFVQFGGGGWEPATFGL
jgi:hypothetical protein